MIKPVKTQESDNEYTNLFFKDDQKTRSYKRRYREGKEGAIILMATKFLSLACIRKESSYGGDLSPRPHYPSMPKYPKGVSSDEEKNMQGSESNALFSVIGMTCSACAGSCGEGGQTPSGDQRGGG
ncbi:hypothetical protein F0562_011492 [Nyssa sinensis]|uniref:Uncharacterized protein n=1 Tax=Nyssa sinensis TaxID=561372 RepID=A0A5J4ZS13_9ASTE|nr:hypothetical protein F0562_011492 [Nyssa sinensis]